MLNGVTPKAWRKGFALCRRRLEQDALGEEKAVYDLEHPDFTVEDGGEEAICWQTVRSWQSGGQMSSGLHRTERGELHVEILQGVCRTALEVNPGDRFVIGDKVYELRQVQQWTGHRLFLLEQV